MHTKKIFHQRPEIYFFTDFGGKNTAEPIADWQTAIELAAIGYKLTSHPHIFIYDKASPLDPIKAGTQLADAFPYTEVENPRIVVHVVDPCVGNASPHPRCIVLRKDATLFIGPDNGTLSEACQEQNIEAIWEIDTLALSARIDIDLSAGGTFHGRDVFAAAAYLLAAESVIITDIARPYAQPHLKYRFEAEPRETKTVQFQQFSTNTWCIPYSELFDTAYFLTIVQCPFYAEKNPQLFLVENGAEEEQIAIFNKKTHNLFVGPNNGVGTSFFHGFCPDDIRAVSLHNIQIHTIDDALQDVFNLKPLTRPLVTVDLLAHELQAASRNERVVQGRIWLDAYGNIKTTLDTELFYQLLQDGFKNIFVHLNGVKKQVLWDTAFSNKMPGVPFVYPGSSGTVGPNPGRTRRYIELSCNASEGVFGKDLFINENKVPFTGQEITFHFFAEKVIMHGLYDYS